MAEDEAAETSVLKNILSFYRQQVDDRKPNSFGLKLGE